MKSITSITALMALAGLLQGCAVYAPAKADGATVRAVMAAQTVPPVKHADTGTDGAAAVAAYNNYQRSYVTPVPQGDSAAFGGK